MISWGKANSLAVRILNTIDPLITRGEVAGSIRRCRPEVHDIDLVLIPKTFLWPGSIGSRLKKEMGAEIVKGGQKLMSVIIEGVQVDLYASNPRSWGVHLLRWTGSMEHNIWLCKRANTLGMKLAVSEGLRKNGKIIASETEAGIFACLGLPWIPPEERER